MSEEQDLDKVEPWREWNEDFTLFVDRVKWYVREVGIPLRIFGKIPDYPTTVKVEKFVSVCEHEIRRAWEEKKPVVTLKSLIEDFLIKNERDETLATRKWRLREKVERLVKEIREEKAKHGV